MHLIESESMNAELICAGQTWTNTRHPVRGKGRIGVVVTAATTVLALSSAVAAGGPVTVLPLSFVGDMVDGVGAIQFIDGLSVNDAGDWIILVDTDHPDSTVDALMLRNGSIALREGQALVAPSGSSIDSFLSFSLDFSGDGLWNLPLIGVPFDEDSGIFAETGLLVQESGLVAAPGLPAGTTYSGFTNVRTGSAGAFLVAASLDVPSSGPFDPALLSLTWSAELGVISESVVVRSGDMIAGQIFEVADVQSGAFSFDLDQFGNVLYVAELLDGTSLLMHNDTVLLTEGAASPIPTVDWGDFGPSARVDLNNAGSWLMKGKLATSVAVDDILVSDGVVLAREGDDASEFGAGATIDSFGPGPVLLGDDGSTLWFVDTTANSDSDTAIVINGSPVIREGVTVLDGSIVSAIPATDRLMTMSPNGRFVIFKATLADGRQGAFLLDRGATGCAEDIDGDGAVGFSDIVTLLDAWGPCTCAADIDGSGDAGFGDLILVLSAWGPC